MTPLGVRAAGGSAPERPEDVPSLRPADERVTAGVDFCCVGCEAV